MKVIFNKENHTYYNKETKQYLISTTQLMRKHNLSPDYSNVDSEILNLSAEHGTLVHKELEDYVNRGYYGATSEFYEYLDYIKDNKITTLKTEWLVHNDIVAGTIDCVIEKGGKNYLVDYKTTSNANLDSVSRQLSIYKALQKVFKIDGLLVFHFKKSGLEVLEIKEKPKEEVEKLFECERQGIPYKQELIGVDYELTEISKVEQSIVALETQLKLLKDTKEQLSAKLIEIMEQRNLKKFENDYITITYKAPYIKKTLDTKALKQEHSELVKDYEKATEVKASVLIKVKNEWNLRFYW